MNISFSPDSYYLYRGYTLRRAAPSGQTFDFLISVPYRLDDGVSVTPVSKTNMSKLHDLQPPIMGLNVEVLSAIPTQEALRLGGCVQYDPQKTGYYHYDGYNTVDSFDSAMLNHSKGIIYRVTYKVQYTSPSGEVDAAIHTEDVFPTILGDVVSVTREGYTLRYLNSTEEKKFSWKNPRVLRIPTSTREMVEKLDLLANLMSNYAGFATPELRTLWTLRRIQANKNQPFDDKGLKKKVAAITAIQEEDPIAGEILQTMASSKASDKVVRNNLIAEFLSSGMEAKEMAASLREAWSAVRHGRDDELNAAVLRLPGASQKHQLNLDQKGALRQKGLGNDAEGIGIDAQTYPLLHKAVTEGAIPFNVFYQPPRGDIKQPINREFDLWEEALRQKGWVETLSAVAANAASRTTYERDITPWLMFMLYSLPEYLNKHAPLPKKKKWRCEPKYVSSSWELEMEEADETGTVKRRSALTPVADNEAGVVTVPYVAMHIGGARTQWCYSRQYHLFQRGFTDPESGGIVTRDLEVKLNGKDDYGLCYYDLNGTTTAQGYPTFLIIFERRVKGTFVHFHRVRPCRTQDGVKTPACKLVERCYQYMAGNVPASDIVAQQGDIMLLQCEGSPIDRKAKVEENALSGDHIVFESHRFVGPLTLYRSTAKTPKNRLGFIHAPNGLSIEHPEHDHVVGLPAGWYEVRRAVSWEANPVSISSYTID